MKEKKIEVRAANTFAAVQDHQCDIVEDRETIKDAKERAKYYVSGDYEKYLGADAGQPMRYAQVVVDGKVHSEFFAKGYRGRIVDRETGEVVSE